MAEDRSTHRQKSWSRGWRQGLATDRLIIRGLQPGDHAAWRRGYIERRAPTHPYDAGPPSSSNLAADRFDERRSLQQRRARGDQTYVFWLFTADAATAVGAIDISVLQRSQNAWGNIGFMIHNQHQRRGYAREALAAVLPYAFAELRFQRLEAAIRPDNEPAIALAISAGMDYECVRKRFWLDPEGWTDHAIYVALRP